MKFFLVCLLAAVAVSAQNNGSAAGSEPAAVAERVTSR